jgi:hypothetical protein
MKMAFTKIFLSLCLAWCLGLCVLPTQVFAMPFYGLKPKELEVRSTFYTTYSTSTAERKHNVKLASTSINGTLIDVGGEFSFNRVVGVRTEKRGYKTAKIITDGKFTDGVGGGVCQVSSTLYNAVLLAGLKITEYHPHSLAVSYVAPSFDAMVNSGSADLRFINNTNNPIIIYANADGERLTIKIVGEPTSEKYVRQSTVIGYIPAPDPEIILDEKGEFPDLYQGETMVLSYGKDGLKSEGHLVVIKDGKPVSVKKIRSDTYKPLRGVIVQGKTPRPIDEQLDETVEQ